MERWVSSKEREEARREEGRDWGRSGGGVWAVRGRARRRRSRCFMAR
jgi:hypothetical protein